MAKSRSVKNSDISNWMVVVMLVAVILVSTFSIIMFLDAAEDAAPEVTAIAQGQVSMALGSNPDAVIPVISDSDSASGEVSMVLAE